MAYKPKDYWLCISIKIKGMVVLFSEINDITLLHSLDDFIAGSVNDTMLVYN
ncbi:hypothetical protein BANRA_02091 [Klebsiella pneumoniae]|nr:hypothetical protein BANRA_02091 [Klebsiella pneumoniae]